MSPPPDGSAALAVRGEPETALATGRSAFEPQSLAEAMKVAEVLHDSAMFRKFGSPAAIFAALATGRELGLTALQSLRTLNFYDGKVQLPGELLVALVKRSPLCEHFETRESTDQKCTIETKRRGATRPDSVTWTIDDARRAGLAGKDNWKAHPAAMLYWRAASTLAKRVYPEITLGLYGDGELADVPAPPPAPVVSSPAPAAAPAPVAAPIPDAETEPVPSAAEMLVARYRARLEKCTTAADIDPISLDAERDAPTLDAETRDRLIAAFRVARQRVAGTR